MIQLVSFELHGLELRGLVSKLKLDVQHAALDVVRDRRCGFERADAYLLVLSGDRGELASVLGCHSVFDGGSSLHFGWRSFAVDRAEAVSSLSARLHLGHASRDADGFADVELFVRPLGNVCSDSVQVGAFGLLELLCDGDQLIEVFLWSGQDRRVCFLHW